MKLKKCYECQNYSLKEICPKCKLKTKDAHYKFIKIKDAPKSTIEYFLKSKS